MQFDVEDVRSLGNAIYPLVIEARANDKREVRWGLRYPFFRAVSIGTDAGHRYSAFSRDISTSGIGLLHSIGLPLGEVEISTTTRRGYLVQCRTRIVQCRLCNEGWYISGGHFVSHSSEELSLLRSGLRPVLLEAKEDDTRDDPTKIRYPCFKPASVTLHDGSRCVAFSRSISSSGIGLLHKMELPTAEVKVSIASGRGYSINVLTRIIRCIPCGGDWYISDGKFASVPAIM